MSLPRFLCLGAWSAVMAFFPTARAAPGELDTSFLPGIVGQAYGMAAQPDGKLIVAGSGNFDVRRFTATGATDASSPSLNGNPQCVRVLPDGKVLIGGSFHSVGGTSRNMVARLNASMTLDTSFNANLSGTNVVVNSLVVQPDGKTIVAGRFSSSNSTARNNIARMNADGSTLDTGFNPNVTGIVYSVARQSDGKILIGGDFTAVGGTARANLARVNADGTLDTDFNVPVSGGVVYSVVVLADQRILIGGAFTQVNSVARAFLARVDASGVLDSGFTPVLQEYPHSISLQADGKMIVGGWFSQVNGVERTNLVRLNVDGTTDASFPGASPAMVYGTGMQPDGKVLLGAAFNTFNGISTGPFVRLENELASQSLNTFSGNRIDWLRGGTAPEGNDVTFELSTNSGSTWSLLGNGTRIAGGWRLSGLSLPASGLVRARLTMSGGRYNGSGAVVQEIAPIGSRPEIAVENSSPMGNGWTCDFGPTGGVQQFTVRNTGNANLTGISVSLTGTNAADFQLSAPSTAVLGAQSSMNFTVSFNPKAMGVRTALVRITSNDHDEPNFDIPLKGTGLLPDIVVYQPSATVIADGGSKAFGHVFVGQSTGLDFTIKNPGNGDLMSVSASIEGANASDFSVTASPASTVGASGGSTTLTVSYSPTATGTRTATLRIGSSVSGSKNPYEIALIGTATVPDIEVQDYTTWIDVPHGSTRSFPQTVTGNISISQHIIRNSGNGALDVTAAIVGPDADQFQMSAYPIGPVNPGGEMTLNGIFQPTSPGTKHATLRITSNDPDESPYDINLTGTAVPAIAEIVVEQPTLTEIPDGGTKDFGRVAAGSYSNLTFTIRNTGYINLTSMGNAVVESATVNEFGLITSPSYNVAPGGSTSFVVRFTPNGTGPRTGMLRIPSNDPDENPYEITLTGTGSGPGNGDVGFDPNAESYVLATCVQADGKIIVGGDFESMGGVSRNYIARLNADGSADADFNPGANDLVYCSAVQVDGKILAGGSFTMVGGANRRGIARLNADGTLEAGFNAQVDGNVYCMAVQADGKILIGGAFTQVGGVARSCLARLNADGSLDGAYNASIYGDAVYGLALDENGLVVVGGKFTAVGMLPRNNLARIHSNGSADLNFNPGPDAFVYAVAIQADGRILLGGYFTSVAATPRNRLARLAADGSLDPYFNPNVNDQVSCITMQANGKVIIGGRFTSVGGVSRNHLARVDANGVLDGAFDPNMNSFVYGAALQPDGKMVVGGEFTSVGGLPRNKVVRLENEDATQALTLPNSSRVQWARGGASPEAAWVSYDLSTNGGSSWTPLGNATRSSVTTGWELTGLSLPASGMVRARAATVSGYSSGSGGMIEAVAMIGGVAVPEIALEQPALTSIADGGNRDFGNAVAGGEKSLVFTVRNLGNADLTGLGITFTGTNAEDFSVSANPVSPVVGSGNTTFTVKFAPASQGIKTATMRVASNDADENPYDVILSGRALVASGDEDGDGISNGTEVAVAQLGFDPFVDSSALRALFQANAAGLGLTGGINEEFLALGSPVLEKNPVTGKFHLRISLERSTNLSTWSPLPGFTPTFDAVNGRIDLEIAPGGPKEFLRVFGAKP